MTGLNFSPGRNNRVYSFVYWCTFDRYLLLLLLLLRGSPIVSINVDLLVDRCFLLIHYAMDAEEFKIFLCFLTLMPLVFNHFQ